MYLGGVAVDPDWAGKGIAADMLRRAIALTREKGYARIELTVATINHRAIRLYEQLGFETEGVLKDYTYLASEERYIDEQVMALLLR
jgi:putative acetyltransferase